MQRRITLSKGEKNNLAGFLDAIDNAKRDFAVACGMILARENLSSCVVDGLEGDELVLSLPDLPPAPESRSDAELGGKKQPSSEGPAR